MPLDVSDREIAMQAGPGLRLPADRPLLLAFYTPLSLRAGRQAHAEPASLIASLGNRIAGLARWHGYRLELDRGRLKGEAARIGALAGWEDARQTPPIHARSSRNGHVRTVQGTYGRLILPAPGETLARLLELGADAQAGGRTTQASAPTKPFPCHRSEPRPHPSLYLAPSQPPPCAGRVRGSIRIQAGEPF